MAFILVNESADMAATKIEFKKQLEDLSEMADWDIVIQLSIERSLSDDKLEIEAIKVRNGKVPNSIQLSLLDDF